MRFRHIINKKKSDLFSIKNPSIPTLSLNNFPKLGAIDEWELNINFKVTGGSGAWRALIGNMYNSVINRGWGVWVSFGNSIHFSWTSTTWELPFSVELYVPYMLTIT